MKMLIKAAQCAGILGIVLHSFAMPVYAAEQQRPPRDEHHSGPPEEALLACKGLTQNDACSFAGFNDELIHGVCSTPPHQTDETTLACKPEHLDGQHSMEPPPDREE
ncbi:MAG TPA: hypothetical protein VLC79_15510 [Cellvibrio sp.]|nr:hypothetical protein [Cellvibrio sp.]